MVAKIYPYKLKVCIHTDLKFIIDLPRICHRKTMDRVMTMGAE